MRNKFFIMLTKTPYGNDENINRLIKAIKDDVVLFSQDSVYSFSTSDTEISKLIEQKVSEGVLIYASEPDCLARGIKITEGIKLANYSDQIDLLCKCDLSY